MNQKALLIGINEYGAGIPGLNGCVNDVRQIEDLLKTYFGFTDTAIRTLTDRAATKAALEAGLDWLVTGNLPGDILVFHYSGHGSQVPDNDNDELDGADEIIVPSDHSWSNPLRDDDLKRAFDRVAPGVSLTVLLDCCHSGTGTRIVPPAAARPEELPQPRYLDPPDALEAAIKSLAQARAAAIQQRADQLRAEGIMPDEVRSLEDIVAFIRRLLGRPATNRFNVVPTHENNVLLAACKDTQVASDAYIDNAYHGAFTYYLTKAVHDAHGTLSYQQLVERIAAGGRQYDQNPQLECDSGRASAPVFQAFSSPAHEPDPSP